MTKLKYVRLYEEYTDLEQKSLEKHYSWQDVRDTIQSKLPFIIIDFESEDSFKKCVNDELFDENFVKQIYYRKNQNTNETEKYYSVFIFESSKDLKDKVLNFIKRFDIMRIIIGEYGQSVPQLYTDGESVDLDSNLYSTLKQDEMGSDDYYKVNDMFYKFIP